MKIIVAPNSFKESLSAREFIKIVRTQAEGCDVIGIPLSDGGDGFLDCLDGKMVEMETTGPDRQEIKVKVKRKEDRFYIESASVLGLRLLKKKRRDPKRTTSYGLGILMKKAAERGAQELIIGFGGSSTVDFGIGALKALGIRFLDQKGVDVPDNASGIRMIDHIETAQLISKIKGVKVTCACDVESNGRDVIIYAPQKGADKGTVGMIEDGIRNIERIFGPDALMIKHGGASGGIPLLFKLLLGAELVSGSEFIIKESGYINALENGNLVITGEGKIDKQTRYGKIPYLVAKLARERGVPVVAIVGAIGELNPEIDELFTGIFSIAPGPISLENLMARTKKELARIVRDILSVIKSFSKEE